MDQQSGDTSDRKKNVYFDARRLAPRFPYHAEVELTGRTHAVGITTDVSAGGVRMALDTPLRVGDVYSVVVKSPTSRVFRNSARVVWREPGTSGHVVGVQFL